MGLCVTAERCDGSSDAGVGGLTGLGALSVTNTLDFGERSFGSQASLPITLENIGSIPITDLRVSAPASPFYFVGGTYPGTGGSCGDALGLGASCLLNIGYQAPPAPAANHEAEIMVSYRYGDESLEKIVGIVGRSGNASFNQARGVSAPVRAGFALSDGVLIGGEFESFNSASRRSVARFTLAGQVDTSLQIGQGFSQGIYSAALAGDGSGDYYLGGNFTSYNGTANVNRIVRLNPDGTLDTGFDIGSGASAGLSAIPYAMAAAADGDLYVGGFFGNYRGTSFINYIARINSDGSLDTGFDIGSGASAGFNNEVRALALANDGSNDVYAGGVFTSYNSVANIRRIVRLNSNGSIDAGFDIGTGAGAGFDNWVYSIVPAEDASDDVYVGGWFTTYNGSSNIRRIVRLNDDGTIDPGFNVGAGATAAFNNAVHVMALAKDGSGDLYVGGDFTSFNGTSNVNRVSRLNSDGSLDTAFNIGSGATAGFDATVRTLIPAVDGSGDIYVGGDFTSYSGTASINYLVRLNSDGSIDATSSSLSGMGSGFDNNVYSFAPVPDGTGTVYVGGNYNSYNGTANTNRIARLKADGTLDTSFNVGTGASSGLNSTVHSMALALDGSGDIYLGGWFNMFNGVMINRIIRLNSDGSRDASFDVGINASSGVDSVVYAITPATDGSHDIYLGGAFTTYKAAPNANRLIRVNSDGTWDTGFNIGTGASAGFNGTVNTVAIALDGSGDVYVGGNFTSYNSTGGLNRIVRLNSDGSIDSSFATGTGFNTSVLQIAIANDGSGDIYAVGDFVTYQGVTQRYLVRLNSDGSVDSGFSVGSGPNTQIETISLTSDGSGDIYIGGWFTSYNGTADVRRIARIQPNGALRSSFDSGFASNGGFNGDVYELVSSGDGSNDIYVGGAFRSYKGVTHGYVARLSPEGVSD